MTQPSETLFRNEVVEHRRDRLYGTVHVAVPVAWQAIGILLFAMLLAACAFFFFGSYSRVELVSGAVTLDRGIAPVVASRAGIVTRVMGEDYQHVPKGGPLIEISTLEGIGNGGTAAGELLKALERQEAHLIAGAEKTQASVAGEESRLRAQIAGLQSEIGSLEN